MKIALLGAANSIHLQRWAHGLAACGHEVSVISQHFGCNNATAAYDATEAGANIRQIALPHTGAFAYFRNAAPLRKILQNLRPDILHANYATGYGSMARRSGFRPLLLSVWGSDVYDFPAKSFIHRHLLQKNLAAATAIASTSHCMAQQAASIHAHPHIFITPFGVDTSLFCPAVQRADSANASIAQAAAKPITIGTVKTLAPAYGIDTLIEAFALLQQSLQQSGFTNTVQLEITGDGVDKPALQQLCHTLGVADAVTFFDAIPHAQVPTQLRRLDIFAALSRMESFGVAAIEAAACGLPVVVSDAPGLVEVTPNQRTGLVVPRNNPQGAAHALEQLVRNASLRQQMGQTGRAHVMAQYGWPVCLEKMQQAYQQTLALAGKQADGAA